ncbi:unnamed protein product [Pleuronectes platessa]|uniref:EGF-like domain-containing protein n=1 Tax=Pleuronectes platessa TaxID=8262 RepID=A0A9N7VHG0_PLEPL|nr:unnamed protein product [Pleuronectes platessa]
MGRCLCPPPLTGPRCTANRSVPAPMFPPSSNNQESSDMEVGREGGGGDAPPERSSECMGGGQTKVRDINTMSEAEPSGVCSDCGVLAMSPAPPAAMLNEALVEL